MDNIIMAQPQGGGFGATQYSTLPPIKGCPPGLEMLTKLDFVQFKQEVSLAEAFGWECKNKFRIFNRDRQDVLYAFEESETCHRICCGPARGFVVHVVDMNRQEVLTISRPFQCCKGCNLCADGCCMYPIFVNDKNGEKIGMVRMMNFCCKPRFGMFDENDTLLYEVTGPCCPCQCCCICTEPLVYPFTDVNRGEMIGNVSKIWAGTLKEVLTDADNYTVSFPMEGDPKHKALMLATVILIDFYFEEMEQGNGGAGGSYG